MRVQKITPKLNYFNDIVSILMVDKGIVKSTIASVVGYLRCKDIVNSSYVAVNNNKIIGFVLVEKTHTSFYVPFIYVSPEYRGNGIATLLLNKVKIVSDRIGYSIQLYFPKKLLNFYKKNNFLTNDDLTVGIYNKFTKNALKENKKWIRNIGVLTWKIVRI